MCEGREDEAIEAGKEGFLLLKQRVGLQNRFLLTFISLLSSLSFSFSLFYYFDLLLLVLWFCLTHGKEVLSLLWNTLCLFPLYLRDK